MMIHVCHLVGLKLPRADVDHLTYVARKLEWILYMTSESFQHYAQPDQDALQATVMHYLGVIKRMATENAVSASASACN